MNDGGLDTHVPKGAEDAQGDFTTVCNQDALESHSLRATEAIYEQSGAITRQNEIPREPYHGNKKTVKSRHKPVIYLHKPTYFLFPAEH